MCLRAVAIAMQCNCNATAMQLHVPQSKQLRLHKIAYAGAHTAADLIGTLSLGRRIPSGLRCVMGGGARFGVRQRCCSLGGCHFSSKVTDRHLDQQEKKIHSDSTVAFAPVACSRQSFHCDGANDTIIMGDTTIMEHAIVIKDISLSSYLSKL